MKQGNLLIYRLLEIKTNSWKILLLIFPPFYSLWMMAIGKRLLNDQNKSDKLFSFFSAGNIMLFTGSFLIAPLLKLFDIDLNLAGERAIPIVLIIYIFWFTTIVMLSSITIKYERLATPDIRFGFETNVDYIKRFFVFLFWFIGFWNYQHIVNKYMKPSGRK